MFISRKKYKELLERICVLETISRSDSRTLEFHWEKIMGHRIRINKIEDSLSGISNASKIEQGISEGVRLASK